MQKNKRCSILLLFKKKIIFCLRKKIKNQKISVVFIFFKRYFEIPNKNGKNDSIGNKRNVLKKTHYKKREEILVNKKKELNKE